MKTSDVLIKTALIAILFILVFGPMALGQAAGGNNQTDKMNEKREKIKAMKVAYLTQSMDLSSTESEKFWPVYNEYDSKREAANKENKQSRKQYKDIGIDNLTDVQAEELAYQEIKHEEQLLALKKEYLEKFKAVVGIRKVIKMYTAEKEFNKILLDKVKQGGRP